MSINLNVPIVMSLEENEIDDHLPSIKFNYSVDVTQFTHTLRFSGEIWVNCHNFDGFLKELRTFKDVATLHDMNSNFLLELSKTRNGIKFIWKVYREGITRDILTATYETIISDDVFIQIKDVFMNYPKWW
ncbi:hypothetical protein ABN220_17775 [Proteus cibi]|uniref:hypothetical protein n=1 Tax=Proteus cibi TaxID=2050966 RepID=UPI0032DBA338